MFSKKVTSIFVRRKSESAPITEKCIEEETKQIVEDQDKKTAASTPDNLSQKMIVTEMAEAKSDEKAEQEQLIALAMQFQPSE